MSYPEKNNPEKNSKKINPESLEKIIQKICTNKLTQKKLSQSIKLNKPEKSKLDMVNILVFWGYEKLFW